MNKMLRYYQRGGPGDEDEDTKSTLGSSSSGTKTGTVTTEKLTETVKADTDPYARSGNEDLERERRLRVIPWARGVDMNDAFRKFVDQSKDELDANYAQYAASVQPPRAPIDKDTYTEQAFISFATGPAGQDWAMRNTRELPPEWGRSQYWEGLSGKYDPVAPMSGREVSLGGESAGARREESRFRRDLQAQIDAERTGAAGSDPNNVFSINLNERYAEPDDYIAYERLRISRMDDGLKGAEKKSADKAQKLAMKRLREYESAKKKGKLSDEDIAYEQSLQKEHSGKTSIAAKRALLDLDAAKAKRGGSRFVGDLIGSLYNTARISDASRRLRELAPERPAAAERPSVNLGLLKSASDMQRQAELGVSPAERRMLREEQGRALNTAYNRVLQSGDPASISGQIQALNLADQRAALERTVASENLRSQRMAALPGVMGQIQEQENFINAYDIELAAINWDDYQNQMASWNASRNAAQADKWNAIRDQAMIAQNAAHKMLPQAQGRNIPYTKWYSDAAYTGQAPPSPPPLIRPGQVGGRPESLAPPPMPPLPNRFNPSDIPSVPVTGAPPPIRGQGAGRPEPIAPSMPPLPNRFNPADIPPETYKYGGRVMKKSADWFSRRF